MSIRPVVIGLDQTFLVNLFPVPAPNAERVFRNLKVTITKPDATHDVITMHSYPADGTAWFEYIADQLGEWKFKFDFLEVYFPAGYYLNGYRVTNTSGTFYDSVYYKPSSSPEQTLVVQQEPCFLGLRGAQMILRLLCCAWNTENFRATALAFVSQ